MRTQTYYTDVVIIGAGPVGLFAIFECGMLGMKCHVVDILDKIGGQCTALYPEKPIYDIPGHPIIAARSLIDQLEKQAEPFKPVYHLGQQVMRLMPLEGGKFRVTTSVDTIIEAGAIIIAGGVGSFVPKRPPLQGIEELEGHSVIYFVDRRQDFADRRIVIAGGGDSAVDWALSLSEVASHIFVVHRRAKFRAAPESVARLHDLANQGKIELVIPYQLSGLERQGNQLTAVRVIHQDDSQRVLDADILLPFFGLSMQLGPIAQWGLNLEYNRITIDQTTSQTTIPGIFAIGDITYYPKKLKLILTGFSEAAYAAHAIYPLIFPDQELHFAYSTNKGIRTLP